MTRVHGPSRKPGGNAPLGFHVCQWCGEEFPRREGSQLFCCTTHRTEFNNLRKERGAQIYDLIMAVRYERKLAAAGKLWSALCTMLHHFREEDRQARAARKSWKPAKETIERRPYLFNMPRGRKNNKDKRS